MMTANGRSEESEEVVDGAEWYRASVQRTVRRLHNFKESPGKCLSKHDHRDDWFKHLLSGNESNLYPGDYIMASLIVSFHFPPGPQEHTLLAEKEMGDKSRVVISEEHTTTAGLCSTISGGFLQNPQLLRKIFNQTGRKKECRAELANSRHTRYSSLKSK